MAKNKDKNKQRGSVRKIDTGYECVIQSSLINPKTGKPKRIKRKGSTEKEARTKALDALNSWEKEIASDKDVKVKKTTTFGEYMSEYLDTIVKPTITGSAYHTYSRTMNANFFKLPIAKYQLQMLNKKVFQDYYDGLRKIKAKSTCSLPLQLCKRCCSWLVTRSLLKENYAEQIVVQKDVKDEYKKEVEDEKKFRKKVFTPEDIQKFYYAFKNNMGQYPVVVLFILETGMRLGEFACLRNSNIDLEKNRIDIVETRSIRYKDNEKGDEVEYYVKVPKNGEERFIIMSDLCRECVIYMQEQTKLKCKNNPDDLLYPVFFSGKRRSNASMEKCFAELCKKLDIDRDIYVNKAGQEVGLSFHALRHTSSTIANTSSNANVINTALKMGHKAIRTENIYTHATEEALSTVVTPSQELLDDYKKDSTTVTEDDNVSSSLSKDEMYYMYLKLKDMFDNNNN